MEIHSVQTVFTPMSGYYGELSVWGTMPPSLQPKPHLHWIKDTEALIRQLRDLLTCSLAPSPSTVDMRVFTLRNLTLTNKINIIFTNTEPELNEAQEGPHMSLSSAARHKRPDEVGGPNFAADVHSATKIKLLQGSLHAKNLFTSGKIWIPHILAPVLL